MGKAKLMDVFLFEVSPFAFGSETYNFGASIKGRNRKILFYVMILRAVFKQKMVFTIRFAWVTRKILYPSLKVFFIIRKNPYTVKRGILWQCRQLFQMYFVLLCLKFRFGPFQLPENSFYCLWLLSKRKFRCLMFIWEVGDAVDDALT